MFSNEKNHKLLKRIPVYWDLNKPLIQYKETPVMLLIDYLCTCGGYLGLFFGLNAQQLFLDIILFISHYFKRYFKRYMFILKNYWFQQKMIRESKKIYFITIDNKQVIQSRLTNGFGSIDRMRIARMELTEK